jgi:hypothetical protein
MRDGLEKELMQSLRYAAGLDKEKLSELVRLATKLFDSIKTKNAKAAAIVSYDFEWWWIYGTPVIEGIAVETVINSEQVQQLIAAVGKNPDVKAVMSSLELTPGSAVQEPVPEPWKMKVAFGAKHGPDPLPWKAGGFGGGGHV